MRIAFFGIYKYGLTTLQAILEHNFNVVAVVTKPDTDSEVQPVAAFGNNVGLPVFQPTKIMTASFHDTVATFRPDLLLVSGFHRLIPGPILNIPHLAAVNVHPSLLPAYRGPTPYKWAIANGEIKTGVTVHLMTTEFDNGDILYQKVIDIAHDDTSESLFQKLCLTASEATTYTLQHFGDGSLIRRPQDEIYASYYGYPSENDTRINWQTDAQQIYNQVRGFYPRPGAWAMYRHWRVQFAPGQVTTQISQLQPGRIVQISPHGVTIATITTDIILNPSYAANSRDLLADLKVAPHAQFE